jgi:lysophospholipase L1-like esterase
MSGNIHNEGYPGLTVAGIQAKVQSSGTLSQRPNLILLMAGTNDIFQGLDPQDTVNALSTLVDYLFQACPDATVLVQHIPMIGYQDFSGVMSTVQQNVIKYNAAISAMVDTRIAQGQYITKIHSRTTTFDHASGDTVVPNDSGYDLMAEAWTERISVAKQNGWIDDPYDLSGTPGNGTNGTTGGRKFQFLGVFPLFH